MQTNNLSKSNSVLIQFINEIRDKNIQNDRMRFRRNIERISEIISYEMSKQLHYEAVNIQTPLGVSPSVQISNEIVICSILRAGLPSHMGVLNYFDNAENAFISAYRKTKNDHSFSIELEYAACPNLNGKTVLIVDPMLATGASILAVYQSLLKFGQPKHIHILSILGSLKGCLYLKENLPKHSTLWIGDIDNELNNKGYIIPGLGDAGDLAFGQKINI